MLCLWYGRIALVIRMNAGFFIDVSRQKNRVAFELPIPAGHRLVRSHSNILLFMMVTEHRKKYKSSDPEHSKRKRPIPLKERDGLYEFKEQINSFVTVSGV
jgi:hypothetical protein